MRQIATLILVICSITAASAANHRTVALSDDPAPGAPSGVRFASFPGYLPTGSGPQLDSAGHTIFTAFLTTPDVLNDSGIWSDASGSLNQFAKSGAHPPDLPDGIRFWNVIDYVFTSYILTSDGHTGIFSSITGAGVTSATNYGLWLGGSNSLGLIMREGDHAPGTPAGVRFNQEGFANTPPLFGAGKRVAFSTTLSGNGIDSKNDRGIWIAELQVLNLVAREGDPASGAESGVVYAHLYGLSALNPAGQVAFGSGLRGAGVSSANDYGVWAGGPGSLRLVAREGNQAPGLSGGISFSSFGRTGIDSSGRVAFPAQVIGHDINSSNNDGIWSERGGSLELVAREGDPAPGTSDGVIFGGSDHGPSVGSHVLLNSAGRIAFRAFLTGDGVDASNREGIWSDQSGILSLIARTGDHAPGMADGVKFARNLNSLAMNSAGQIAFTAGLTAGGVDDTSGFGIWAQDRSGVLQLVCRTGQLIEVAPGDFRTITYVDFLSASGNADGRPSGFNDRGQLAFYAAFTDGSDGIFVSNRVAIPEPPSIVLSCATMALILAWRPPNRSHVIV